MTARSHPGRISGAAGRAANDPSGHSRRSAEGVGFEPTMTVTSHSGFQDRRKPSRPVTGHPLLSRNPRPGRASRDGPGPAGTASTRHGCSPDVPRRAVPAMTGKGRFPDGSAVLVRFPLTPEQDPDARGRGCLARCWSRPARMSGRVQVDARELATLEDGSQPPPGTPDDALWFPVCFRAASELRPPGGHPVSAFRCPCCGDDVFGTPPVCGDCRGGGLPGHHGRQRGSGAVGLSARAR